ncbi:hypothetical protein ADK76_22690 [Streptomyces griseoflavus]|uniref:hypothetical protein n=1 Tax=Streptomyces rimosus TaxID=1927 RepID=UPI0004C9DD31|nr:hypothetical protein [Streptomyces rimosus]KOG54728.1 hypothetical protein ADK76_22690 [Streptomyces griseoflavus]
MLLDPEKTLFIRGATPVLLLSEAPVHDALPVLTAPDGAVPRCDGWSILPKLTLCVVDGPGEAGIMIPAYVAPVIDGDGGSGGGDGAAGGTGGTDGPGEMAAWCTDVEAAGGAVVLSLDALPGVLDWPHLLGSGTARGGFLPGLS